MGFLNSQAKVLLNLLPAKYICGVEFKRQKVTRFNERPVEYAFVFDQIARLYPQKVLDVGTGASSLPHLMRKCNCLVTAIDNIKDYWPSGMANRHYHVIDDDITNPNLNDMFDLITCISVLEHIGNPDLALMNMFALLNPGGHLVLTFPYNEKIYHGNVYDLPGSSYGQDAPYITQSYSRAELDKWVLDNNGVIVSQEYWQFWDGELWTVGNQIIPPVKATAEDPHQLSCVLIRKAS